MKLLLLASLLLLQTLLFGQTKEEREYIVAHYDKTEYQIPMRDGIKLHTIVYAPKDSKNKYPFLMQRTCYSVAPYGEKYRTSLGPSPMLMKSGYIFVYQDVRGRYMSEGTFDNMRPHIAGNDPKNTKDIDESSDTYDTIDWLLKKVKNNNGKFGQWGISYPGFYTAAALPEAHPALKASSPQAPISDFFFDDFHHMGAFLLSYLKAFPVFGIQKEELTTKSWYNDDWDKLNALEYNQDDAYDFNLKLGTAKNITDEVYPNNFFWNQMVEHPNYDEFWQKRSILPHLKDVRHAVLTVGGWYDAEDLFGPLNIYKNLEKNNPGISNTIVMGPWSHGDWARENGHQIVNHIFFGKNISTFYQENIEFPFFEFHLKGHKKLDIPEAYLFDTGLKEWKKFDTWPPVVKEPVTLAFGEKNQLFVNKAVDEKAKFSYTSDPKNPVPYTSEISPVTFTPRKFMTDDQRHVAKRSDVLTFETEVLTEDFTLAGEIMAKLQVAISTTDADFIVKLIDVYSDNEEPMPFLSKEIDLNGYQQLVRHEVFRARFRDSFSKPIPFEANKETAVNFPLQDILHTFKKGHKVMIQIHSTWFPYIDRNPQNYVENIYKATEADFTESVITILGSSKIVIGGKNEFVPK